MKPKKLLFQAFSETKLQPELHASKMAYGRLTRRKNIIKTTISNNPYGKTYHHERIKFTKGDNYQNYLINAISYTLEEFFMNNDDKFTIHINNPHHE